MSFRSDCKGKNQLFHYFCHLDFSTSTAPGLFTLTLDIRLSHGILYIQYVMSCGLSDSQREDVFYNNAAKFMKLN